MFKGIKASSLPVRCYSQNGAWMDKDFFGNLFHKKFVPKFQSFWKKESPPQKSVSLLLDNLPSPPSMLSSDDDLIKCLPPPTNVKAIIHPWLNV
jgi:hypothetical protein